MDGLINLNKPRGRTSAKTLYAVRKITGIRKSGHAGTLDPLADGVLILCLGKATKLVEQLMDQPKVYRATARLDVTSASFDADSPLEPVAVRTVPTAEQVAAACAALEGEIAQVPPAVSALKVGGQPAYKLARAGKPPQLEPRKVHIYWLHIHRYAWPELDFEMACGRGTYVRSVIRDVGVALGTGGCLTALTRVAIGPFHVKNAWTLERLQEATSGQDYLIPLETARNLLAIRPIPTPPRPAM